MLPRAKQETITETDSTIGLVWLGLGPFLFLYLLIFGNLARFTVLATGEQSSAFFIMVIAQLLGILLVYWLIMRNGGVIKSIITAILGLALIIMLINPWPTGWLAILQVILGQVILALLMSVIVLGIGASNGRFGLRNLILGNGLGWLLMAMFVFLYYAGYDIPLPFKNDLLFSIAALIVAICAFFTARVIPQTISTNETNEKPLNKKFIFALFLLLLIPVFQFLSYFQWAPFEFHYGWPVRVMTYNIHNGFDQKGHLGLEALAQVIEAERPDIISLQEINRGWVVNGSTDMLSWFSKPTQYQI